MTETGAQEHGYRDAGEFRGSEKRVIHSDATAADQAAVQHNRPDVKELLSLLCKDFLQDSGLQDLSTTNKANIS